MMVLSGQPGPRPKNKANLTVPGVHAGQAASLVASQSPSPAVAARPPGSLGAAAAACPGRAAASGASPLTELDTKRNFKLKRREAARRPRASGAIVRLHAPKPSLRLRCHRWRISSRVQNFKPRAQPAP
jgi:hypothetical protein